MAVTINTLKYIPDLPAAAAAAGADLLHLSQGNTDKQLTLTQLARFITNLTQPIGAMMFFATKGKDPNALFPGQTWVRYGAGRHIRVCADNEANLGAAIGSDAIQLTGNELPAHAHGAAGLTITGDGQHIHDGYVDGVGDHAHSAWTDAQGNHTHRAWTDAQGEHIHGAWTDAQGNHQHGVGIRSPSNWGGSAGYYGTRAVGLGSGGWAQGGGQTGSEAATSVDGNHAHNVGIGAAGNHSHNVGMDGAGQHGHNVGIGGAGAHNHHFRVGGGAHTHGISGATAISGTGAAFSIVPATICVAAWQRTA